MREFTKMLPDELQQLPWDQMIRHEPVDTRPSRDGKKVLCGMCRAPVDEKFAHCPADEDLLLPYPEQFFARQEYFAASVARSAAMRQLADTLATDQASVATEAQASRMRRLVEWLIEVTLTQEQRFTLEASIAESTAEDFRQTIANIEVQQRRQALLQGVSSSAPVPRNRPNLIVPG
jgi:ribosomal protein L17